MDTLNASTAASKASARALSNLEARRTTSLAFLTRSRSTALFLRLALLLLCAAPALAQDHPTEPQVKAAYLFNFGKFTRWQADRAGVANFQICVLGKDPFGAVLDSTVSGENINGKKIAVKRMLALQDAAECSVLFVSASEENRLPSILATAQQFSILTVSDIPHFAERGGVIGLMLQQGKIRFEVNRDAAEKSRLSLSSELLKVATKVIEKSGSGT